MDQPPSEIVQTPPEPGARPRRTARRWLRFAAGVLGALALAVVLRTFVYESAVVVGRSMWPTLRPGEYLLTCKTVCVRRLPKRSEIVTFRAPGPGKIVAIKRVIGLPGDWIQIWGTQVFVNGKRLGEPYARAKQAVARPPVYVPPGSIYVLGDNRDNSEDSRVWGPIPLSSVRGMAMFLYFPPHHARRAG